MRFFYNTNINFMKHRKAFFIFSGLMILFSIFCWKKYGLNYGIEFKGGTQIIFKYKEPVNTVLLSGVRSKVNRMNLGEVVVHEYGERDSKGRFFSLLIRVEATSENVKKQDERGDIAELISQELMSDAAKAELNSGKENLNSAGKVKIENFLEGSGFATQTMPAYLSKVLKPDEIKDLTLQQQYYRLISSTIVDYRDSADVAIIKDFKDLLKINKEPELIAANNGKPVNLISAQLLQKLQQHFFLEDFVVIGVDMVGPSIGSDLRKSAINSIIWATIGILIYITIRFKFRFGVASVLAIIHDTLITVGLYALSRKPFSLAIVAALLTIVGYSLNDTIVVCDRIRENLKKHRGPGVSYQELVNLSINQTLSRTLLTASTTLIVLVFLLFLGGEVLSGFSFAMLVGMIVGTYSSDCLVSPILIVWNNFQEKYRKKEVSRGTDYVKRSLKTLFPERRKEEKTKDDSVEQPQAVDKPSSFGQPRMPAAFPDRMKKRHHKRKKGITGRKKKRRH